MSAFYVILITQEKRPIAVRMCRPARINTIGLSHPFSTTKELILMALTAEDLQAISTLIQPLIQPLNDSICIMQKDLTEVKDDVSTMKNDIFSLKNDVTDLKIDVAELKTDVAGLKIDVAELKNDVADLKTDVEGLKTDVARLKADVTGLKAEIIELKNRVGCLEDRMLILEKRMDKMENELHKINLHLETETDPGVQLIAESHIDLTRKLNEAIPAADKNLAYEVKVNYLIGEVRELREDVEMLKKNNRTA